MSKKKLFLFSMFSLLLLFTLAACGAKNQAMTDKEKSEESGKAKEDENTAGKEKEDEVKIAGSIEEIIEEKAGEYSGNAFNEAVVHRVLDETSFQDKDSFQIYETLLSLISEGENYSPLTFSNICGLP
uniref:Lipoprotein n=1 Tax=Staphylococcus aureus TaxID=1280 RepID=A0AAE6F2A9_STAAU